MRSAPRVCGFRGVIVTSAPARLQRPGTVAVTADGSSQTIHSFLAICIAEELDARSHASLRRKTRIHAASVSKGVHNSAGSSYMTMEEVV